MPGIGIGNGVWKSGGKAWSPLSLPDLVAAYLGKDVPDGAVASVPARKGTTALTVTGTATASGGLISMAGDGIAKATFAWNAPASRYVVFRCTDVWASTRCLLDGNTGTLPMLDHNSAAAIRMYTPSNGNYTAAHTYDNSWHIWGNGWGLLNETNGFLVRDLTTLKSNGAFTATINPGGLTIGGTAASARRTPCQWAMALCYSTLHDAATRAKIVAWLLAEAQTVYGILTAGGLLWMANQWTANQWMANQWL